MDTGTTGPERGRRRARAKIVETPMAQTQVRMPEDLLKLYQFLGRFVEGGQNRLMTWALAECAGRLMAIERSAASALGVTARPVVVTSEPIALESLFAFGRDVWVYGENGPEMKRLCYSNGRMVIEEPSQPMDPDTGAPLPADE